jgi:hypothetical protein
MARFSKEQKQYLSGVNFDLTARHTNLNLNKQHGCHDVTPLLPKNVSKDPIKNKNQGKVVAAFL